MDTNKGEDMTEYDEWIVRRKDALSPGDVVTPLNRDMGKIDPLRPVVGEVVSIHTAYVELDTDGQRWYSYRDEVFAVKPPVAEV